MTIALALIGLLMIVVGIKKGPFCSPVLPEDPWFWYSGLLVAFGTSTLIGLIFLQGG